MNSKQIITLNVPKPVLNAIQELVENGKYESRSHFVRECLTGFLKSEKEYWDGLKTKPERCGTGIITVNLEKEDIKFIRQLVGGMGDYLFPSRSELTRVAVREVLFKEEFISNFTPLPTEPIPIVTDKKGKTWNIKKRSWNIDTERYEYV